MAWSPEEQRVTLTWALGLLIGVHHNWAAVKEKQDADPGSGAAGPSKGQRIHLKLSESTRRQPGGMTRRALPCGDRQGCWGRPACWGVLATPARSQTAQGRLQDPCSQAPSGGRRLAPYLLAPFRWTLLSELLAPAVLFHAAFCRDSNRQP